MKFFSEMIKEARAIICSSGSKYIEIIKAKVVTNCIIIFCTRLLIIFFNFIAIQRLATWKGALQVPQVHAVYTDEQNYIRKQISYRQGNRKESSC